MKLKQLSWSVHAPPIFDTVLQTPHAARGEMVHALPWHCAGTMHGAPSDSCPAGGVHVSGQRSKSSYRSHVIAVSALAQATTRAAVSLTLGDISRRRQLSFDRSLHVAKSFQPYSKS